MNCVEIIGVNEDLMRIGAMVLQYIDQFACRRPIKITIQFQVSTISGMMNENFEIRCHR
jgi:hypothetical protein